MLCYLALLSKKHGHVTLTRHEYELVICMFQVSVSLYTDFPFSFSYSQDNKLMFSRKVQKGLVIMFFSSLRFSVFRYL